MPGLMIMANHQTFSSQIKHVSDQKNLPRQICYTSSMKISLSLLKIINVWTIFSPYHKHCMHAHSHIRTHKHTSFCELLQKLSGPSAIASHNLTVQCRPLSNAFSNFNRHPIASPTLLITWLLVTNTLKNFTPIPR